MLANRKQAKPGSRPRWLAIVWMMCLAGCGEIVPERPNVLIYVVSSLRADALGVYDPERTNTPHFDEFATSGAIFEAAYSSSSWSRPAMASMLSGLYPWHHGVLGLDDGLPSSVPNLARSFSAHGYTSALITANPNVGPLFGFDEGFDESIELYSRSQKGRVQEHELIAGSEIVTRVALKWIEERPQPFFLVVLAIDPHAPYLPPRSYDPAHFRARSGADGRIASLDRLSKSRRPDDEARIRELYQAEVGFSDNSFGELVAELRRRGELDRTVIVLTSDHGEAFWEYDLQGHGKSLSHEVLHIPLAIRYPRAKQLPPGVRTPMPISLVDLAPTLLELAGLPLPPDLDGRSFFESAIRARSPILAGLDTSERTLLAAMEEPYKLLWDRELGEISLFDMRVTHPESNPFDPRSDDAARAAHARLMTALSEGLRVRDEAISGGAPGSLPPDIEGDLRSFGLSP